jgi:hypothetical protein
VWTDNLGRWFPQTSSGWEGDTIAFAGDFVLDDKKGTVRDTFIKKERPEHGDAGRRADRRSLAALLSAGLPQMIQSPPTIRIR